MLTLLGVVLVIGDTMGCAADQDEDVATPRRAMRLTTSGRLPVDLFSRHMPEFAFTVLEAGGTVGSLEALQKGEADFAFTTADVTYMAYVGQLAALPGRADRLRAIAVLYPDTFHLLVPRGSPIRSVDDLGGKRIGFGQVGGATAVSVELLLAELGLSLEELHGELLPREDIPRRFADGTLDAAFVLGGQSTRYVTSPTQEGARLVELAGPGIVSMRSDFPFFKPTVVPPNTYPGQHEAVMTVAVDALLICRADLEEAIVYKLTRGLFNLLPEWAETRGAVRRMEVHRAAATPIPLHPGAARYYREQELRPQQLWQ